MTLPTLLDLAAGGLPDVAKEASQKRMDGELGPLQHGRRAGQASHDVGDLFRV